MSRAPNQYDTDFTDTPQFPNRHVDAGEYSRRLGVIHNLMPYPHYGTNPWENLSTLREFLDDIPDTTATWQFRELEGGAAASWWQTNRRETFVGLLGGWKMGEYGKRARFVNPGYKHADAIDWTPEGPRIAHAERMASFGRFSLADIAPRFNLKRAGLHRYLKRHGVPWGHLRARGKRRLGNTVRCVTAWTDWTVCDCAAALGMAESTLGDWVREVATVDVPPDPATHDRSSNWD